MLAQENFREKIIFSSVVPRDFAGSTLLGYLVRRFTYLSEQEWLGQISLGRIEKNGQHCPGQGLLLAGDVIAFSVDQSEFPEPAADLDFQIIYEDDWLLGINKPGNLLVHRQGRSLTHNLIYQLRHVYQPSYPEAGVVNRLDRETSGVVLVARRPEFLARVNALFAAHKVTKTYLAVVHGRLELCQGEIDLPIGRDSQSAVSYRYRADSRAIDAKEALTRYQVVAESGNLSLLRLQPRTGRTHQLRVHLSHIGHPIMHDKLYGKSDEEFLAWRQRPLAEQATGQGRRQALHAESLAFTHPWTGEEVRIVAELPGDMRELIEGKGAHEEAMRTQSL
ncbi:MAG: RluA family pseudouridine synthase [Desulfobulbaceae bacterium]|nr:RluA family pseudouridine synthase [Desulfobulbaceae bacterium]